MISLPLTGIPVLSEHLDNGCRFGGSALVRTVTIRRE